MPIANNASAHTAAQPPARVATRWNGRRWRRAENGNSAGRARSAKRHHRQLLEQQKSTRRHLVEQERFRQQMAEWKTENVPGNEQLVEPQ
jgi:hypothetical protein